jgi:ubiquinone biosynthesis protein
MIPVKESARVINILWVMMRHGLDNFVLSSQKFRFIRFMRLLSPFYWSHRAKQTPRGVRIRRALEELGPIYVKFGQILSTRRDLLPDDIAEELVKLQDRVLPFDGKKAIKVIESQLEDTIENLFDDFDPTPLASASIAQVHTAKLKDGSDVVVKVVRPGIEKTIDRDIRLLFTIARLARRYSADAKRLRPVEVVDEYKKTIYDELDLMREAANCALLRRNFENSDMLYVPQIYWEYTRSSVMTQERIYGTPVDDVESHIKNGVDLERLSALGVEIFFTQVFRDNFFHADMHPGNIFVRDDGNYVGVDFGIMGSLTTEDQRYLAENLLAFFHRDYRKVAELHVDSGWVPRDTRVEEFEAAIRAVSEPIWEKPISEISFGHFLLRLFQTARRFNMEVQPQLVLLQKTLLNIEGLGRQLYPQLDLWQTAKPFMEKWVAEQVGVKAFARRIKDSLPQLSEELPQLPHLTYRVLKKAADGELTLNWQSNQLDEIKQQLADSALRGRLLHSGGILIVAGLLVHLADKPLVPMIDNLWVTAGSAGIGALLVIAGLFKR